MNSISIGFFGDGDCGANGLRKLLCESKSDISIDVRFVVVRTMGNDSKIREIANKYGIDVLRSENINSDFFIRQLSEYEADLFVVDSFDQIFRSRIRNIPSLGVINCHSGKLPFYRGRCPLIWALINDEKEFGITVHYMDAGIDTGDIILQRLFPITDEDDLKTISDRDAVACADIIYDAIGLIASGSVRVTKQTDIDPIGTYCGGRIDGDEVIKWNETSREIFSFVRALCNPGPTAISFRNGNCVRINKVREVKGAHIYKGIPGQIIGKGQCGLYVKTGDSIVELIDYDSDGAPLRVGDRLTDG